MAITVGRMTCSYTGIFEAYNRWERLLHLAGRKNGYRDDLSLSQL